jgi:putative RNA 2'-phosphotransferase
VGQGGGMTTRDSRETRISRHLALHLRHRPDLLGLTLDEGGWVEIDALLAASCAHGFPVTREELDRVVRNSDKQRYAIEGTRIRANQGHSVAVDLDLPVADPPPRLFHGTVAGTLEAIRAEGLRPMRRHAVHLSGDRRTADRVGARRGVPVVLEVDAAAMRRAGHVFRVSANGVWLTEHVPVPFLTFPPHLPGAPEPGEVPSDA